MTLNERMMVQSNILRAKLLLENLEQRNSSPGRKAKGKDLEDWQTLRTIANQQVAQMQAAEKPDPTVTELPLTPDTEKE